MQPRFDAERLLRDALPAGCRLCDEPLGRTGPICLECRLAIVPTSGLRCRRCAGPVDEILDGREEQCLGCADRPPPQASTTVYGEYQDRLRDALLALKHGRCDRLAPELAARMSACLELSQGIDLVTWVPSSPWRRLFLGESAARLLACEVAHRLDRPVACTLRRRDRGRQVQRSAAARRSLPAGAFGVRKVKPLIGKRLLLVDDVRTTGATLARASATLLAAGASRVDALALAITPPSGVSG